MFEEEKGIVGKEGEGEVRVPQGSNVGFCVMFEQMVEPLWKGKGEAWHRIVLAIFCGLIGHRSHNIGAINNLNKTKTRSNRKGTNKWFIGACKVLLVSVLPYAAGESQD